MLSQFLLGVVVGGMVSVPLGPFGIWTIQVFIREGWKTAITVALGGVIGDILILLGYIIGSQIVQYFSPDAEHLLQHFLNNGIVRGAGLLAVGIFLMFAALSKNATAKSGGFLTSFFGALAPVNILFIGLTLSYLGIQAGSAKEYLEYLLMGFFVGGFCTWIGCVKVFSMLNFVRTYLKPLLQIGGCASIGMGILWILWSIAW